MKFATHMKSQTIPEWQSRYIDYITLKKWVKTSTAKTDIESKSLEREKNSEPAHDIILEFTAKLREENDKVNNFYQDQCKYALQRYTKLLSSMYDVSLINNYDSSMVFRRKSFSTYVSAQDISTGSWSGNEDDFYSETFKGRWNSSPNYCKEKLSKAMLEHHRMILMLKDFKTLNHNGFAKIIKKFDKYMNSNVKDEFVVECCEWMTSRVPEDQLEKIQKLYIIVFENGDRHKAMEILRSQTGQSDSYHGTAYRVGFLLGLSLMLIALTIKKGIRINFKSKNVELYNYVLYIFAGLSQPILLTWGIALNIMIWTKFNINYTFVFEMDQRNHLYKHEFLDLAAAFTFVWSLGCWLFITRDLNSIISAHKQPFMLCCIMLGMMLLPLNVFYRRARYWLMHVLLRIAASPFTRVYFKDFFVADQLTSLATTFRAVSMMAALMKLDHDIERFWIGPVLLTLPPFWRMMQCVRRYYDSHDAFPHLLNCGKYFMALLVIAISAIRQHYADSDALKVLWIVASSVATLYAFSWDIFMDWGLFQRGSRNWLLRDQLLFNWKGYYYIAIVSNFFLRGCWVVMISEWGIDLPHAILISIVGILEIYRRVQWNLIRLENEHANNCGQFRAVRDIPLPEVHVYCEEISSKWKVEDDN